MAHCCSRPRRKGEPAACEEGPNAVATASQLVFATSLSISQPASQSESRQASKQARKERRLAAVTVLAVFLASQGAGERFAASFLHALFSTRSVGPRTYHGGRTTADGRTSMVVAAKIEESKCRRSSRSLSRVEGRRQQQCSELVA